MMGGNDNVDVIITNPNDKANPQAGTNTKPGDRISTSFEMPIWHFKL